MRRLVLIIFIGTLFLTGIITAYADAGTESAPEKKRYVSGSGQYAFDVIPGERESQPPDSEDRAENMPEAEAANEITDGHCRGVFYIAQNGSYCPQLSFPLVDRYPPLSALVSNSGQYVVTFRHGAHTVVIYRTDGTLIRQLGLEDFLTKEDISTFSYIDSPWWGEGHYLDEGNNLLVLRILSNIKPRPLEETFYELKVELLTGNLIEPKRSFLLWSSADGELPEDDERKLGVPEQPCVATEKMADARGIMYVDSGALVNRATVRITQMFPPVARVVSLTGTVVVEVLVDEKGSVACARAISGHPLLRAAAIKAARQWKFAPLESFDSPVKMIGTIAFHFGRAREPLSSRTPAN